MTQHSYACEPAPAQFPPAIVVGRYLLHRQIAQGGMATIHIARLMGDEGFSRIVAAKRLQPQFAEDPEFVAMFLDEARIASRVNHRNVVAVLDVVASDGEVILVQEYVHGVPLHRLLRAARNSHARVPLDIAVSIGCQVLAGLQAAHETRDEAGMPLNIVHRDVSPQNIMVAVDGTARLLDFGIAKARMATHITREGQFKGKLAYAAPEQLFGRAMQQSDLYSLAMVVWELVAGHHMHHDVESEAQLIASTLNGKPPTFSEALARRRDIGPERWRQLLAIEPVLKIGLAVQLNDRWTSAADMERALGDVMRPASPNDVAAWLRSAGKAFIDEHDSVLAAEEASWRQIGTTIRRRLAQLRVDLQGDTHASAPQPNAAAQPPRPVARRWRPGPSAWVAILLVAILAIVITYAVSRSPSRAALTPAPIAPVAIPAVGSAGLRPEPPPALPTVHESVGAPQSPELPAVREREPIEIVIPQTAGPARPSRPSQNMRTLSGTKKPEPVTVQPPPAPPPAAESTADCDTPFYFEGTKKVFKSYCNLSSMVRQ